MLLAKPQRYECKAWAASVSRGSRHVSRRWSKDGAITDSGLSQVYAAFRGAATGGPLPHPEDIRAMLRRALNILQTTRRAEELLYLRNAIRRHLEQGTSLDQAFGYARAGKGAPPLDPDRARQLACAVFEHRFIKGRNADTAGYDAGKVFGVSKTQALAAFREHAGHALRTWKADRQGRDRKPRWTSEEAKRLTRYYSHQRPDK